MSCSRTQHGGGRSRTPDLSLRSPTLYHWATALPPSTTGIFSWKGHKPHWDAYSNVQLVCVLTMGGGKAVQGGLSWPPPRISERKDNQQILLHHLLQEYLVERDINFISVNLRCLLQMFSWVTYWQGVGGKLSRAVYLDPHPEFQIEWIISKFYYTIHYRNN